MALEQVELLMAKGVAPSSIIIGHLDRRLEKDYILEVARTGVFLGFDQISKEKYVADRSRIEMILTLIEAGHENQILLSETSPEGPIGPATVITATWVHLYSLAFHTLATGSRRRRKDY